MILITGQVKIRAGKVDEALAVSQAHVLRSRVEPGCLEHGVHRSHEDADRLVFVERWADLPALLAHFAVPESRQFVQAITALAEAPPAMTIFEATELKLGA